jgi:uncharacterized membrane protein YgdD (TMEM256/DUF423 family)
MYKPALIAGTILGALAVILGAFGAHSLKAFFSTDQLQVFEKGVTYQYYHVFALLAAGILFMQYPGENIKWATVFFILGIFFFSGSLYIYTYMDAKAINVPDIARLVTPLGGLCFIAGWLLLLSVFLKK